MTFASLSAGSRSVTRRLNLAKPPENALIAARIQGFSSYGLSVSSRSPTFDVIRRTWDEKLNSSPRSLATFRRPSRPTVKFPFRSRNLPPPPALMGVARGEESALPLQSRPARLGALQLALDDFPVPFGVLGSGAITGANRATGAGSREWRLLVIHPRFRG